MTWRLTITKPRALALSVMFLLGVAGVSAGHEFFGRFMAEKPAAVPTAGAPSEADKAAWEALRTPTVVQPLTDREEAVRINASLPYSPAPIEAARPFVLHAGAADQAAAIECLTAAVYYEAGFEPADGQRAVAQVVLNRLRHPAFPKTVCGVVYQGAPDPGCQFSFACDGSLAKAPQPAAWRRARAVAQAALRGNVMAGIGEATHYHTDWVAPYWAPRLAKVKQIGAHIFYRWPGGWGRPAAFTGRYAGGEQPFESAVLTKADAPVAAVAADPTDRHAPNDVGGRIDPSLGWKPSFKLSTEREGAMARILAGQQAQDAPATAAASQAAEG